MKRTAMLFLALLFASSGAMAAVLDSDHADNAAYADGWQSGDDGSIEASYLGAWVMGGAAAAPNVAIESSTGLGTGEAAVDRNGKAFTMLEPTGGYVDLFRFIEPMGLEVGETFSMDMAVNFRAGYKGLDVRDSNENTLFGFNIGEEDYVVSKAASGNGSIGSTYAAQTVFLLSFKQDTAEEGTWTVTRRGGVESTTQGKYAGRLHSIKLYSGGQAGHPEDALYFNNLKITTAAR